MTLPGRIPVELGRDPAREAASAELSGPLYREQQPGLLQRASDAVADWLNDLLQGAGGLSPGGPWGWLLLFLILAALTAVVLRRTGRWQLRATADRALFAGSTVSAAEHRRAAEAHAAAGQFAEAVRERLRAIVRSLEERGVLEHRPGRTADEVAVEAGALLPHVREPMQRAAIIFDEIWYGARPATAQAYATLTEVDASVESTQALIR